MMNAEDQELLEIEKMLESIKETEPAPGLRGETLTQARKTWQRTSNFSCFTLVKWAAVAVIIFSVGYILGVKKGNFKEETTKEVEKGINAEEFKRIEIDKDQILKGER